ncbi:phospholipase D-like domain-containing protein [Occultella kanbiaonis]|uniref:phospholipase D-like domain-containing protein n=1 Tax=Occultella kanbiaonis TaxID=2675754 RepID=UPI00143D627A|nr:phospholipase D-like domain-containing protein [Occultella kanbiaonis]
MSAVGAARESVLLASPYLGGRVAGDLAVIAKSSAASWRLLTDLSPIAIAYGSLNTEGLLALLRSGVKVRSLRRLHAKVTLCDGGFGLIGSANLTSPGLGVASPSNFEIGVLLSADQRTSARTVFDTWWDDAVGVDQRAIKDAEAAARLLPKPVRERTRGRASKTGSVLANTLMAEARDRGLWVKAVDHSEPWKRGFWFSNSSRGQPRFRVGDLVLMYAKDLRACNAIVEVLEESRNDPPYMERSGASSYEAHRWPWVSNVKPRLNIPEAEAIPLAELGATPKALQNGYKRLDLAQFTAALRYIIDLEPREPSASGRSNG